MLPRALAACVLFGIDAAALPGRRTSCHDAACQVEDDAGSLLNVRGSGSDLGSIVEDMDPGLWNYPPEMLNVSMLLDDHNAPCSTVFLTTVLGTKPDPVHPAKTPPDLLYFVSLYRSVLSLPGRKKAKVVFLHDFLPDRLVSKYTTADGTVSFVKVNISVPQFEHLSLNDLRYFLFEEEIKKHPEWDTVFMTDTTDVTVVHNPCALVERSPEKVFVHSQPEKLSGWPRGEMEKLGDKYMKWLLENTDFDNLTYLNAGIQGGKRDVMLRALSYLNQVFSDPDLPKKPSGRPLDCNMAAVNYVYRRYFPNDFVTGYPLHSKWLQRENRTDVYLKHK